MRKRKNQGSEPHKILKELGWVCKKCNRVWTLDMKKCPICKENQT
jgi:rubrerythrin